MKHYAVFNKTTGQLVSTGTIVSDNLPDNLGVVEVWDGNERFSPENIPGLKWNATERRFTQDTLTVSRTIIDGDGVDSSTVTFKSDDPNPPNSIVFNINGTDQEVNLVDGLAVIDVNSSTPGDTITVSVNVDSRMTAMIEVNDASS